HRSRPGRPLVCCAFELDHGDLAHPVSLCVRGGCAQRPDAPAPAIADGWPIFPAPALAHAVAVLAVEVLGLTQEVQAELEEVVERTAWVRLACRDEEDPRHVVGAIAASTSRR